MAVSFVDGPAAGLQVVDDITGLDGYHPLHSVRADLLTRLGRPDEAREQQERAAALTRKTQAQEALLARQAHLLTPRSHS